MTTEIDPQESMSHTLTWTGVMIVVIGTLVYFAL
jgi:hypothetical protein